MYLLQPETSKPKCFIFRAIAFVITADIKQMYRQILLVREHWDYQGILWRFDSKEELRDYRLNTVTYGVSSAPFLALRTLTQLAKIGENQFPLAARALLEHTYVVDIISGTNSIEETQQLKAALEQLLETGGFKLHKWCSNNSLTLSVRETDIFTDEFLLYRTGVVRVRLHVQIPEV